MGPAKDTKTRHLEMLGMAEARALQALVMLGLRYIRMGPGYKTRAKRTFSRINGLMRDAVYMPVDCNDDFTVGPEKHVLETRR